MGKPVPVHFPHLSIDMQRRTYLEMPDTVKVEVERRIHDGERWTSMQKAYVLTAPRVQTIAYVLAYALTRARACGRAGIWIPLRMSDGFDSTYANGICLQRSPGDESIMEVLV